MYENLFMGTKILIVHHHLCKLQILLNFAQVIDFKKKQFYGHFLNNICYPTPTRPLKEHH
jgi:hypothetical protein